MSVDNLLNIIRKKKGKQQIILWKTIWNVTQNSFGQIHCKLHNTRSVFANTTLVLKWVLKWRQKTVFGTLHKTLSNLQPTWMIMGPTQKQKIGFS